MEAAEWREQYCAEPATALPSNEWYNTEGFPEVSADRQRAIDEFIEQPELRWPNFTYPRLDPSALYLAERSLQGLLASSETIKPAESADMSYERAARKLAETYRHLEAVRLLNRTGEKEALSRQRAGDMTMELFGVPEKPVFDSLLGHVRQSAKSLASPPEAARELLGLTGDVVADQEETYFDLSDKTRKAIRSDLESLFPKLDEALLSAEGPKISAEESVPYFQRMIDVIGLGGQGCHAKLGEGAAVSTLASTGAITVGRNRKPFTPVGLNGVMVHEAIGHLWRGRNGGSGNLAFEEGFAVALEQIITGQKRLPGKQYYLSLGLQLGLDQSGQLRDFRDTYEVMWRAGVVAQLAEGVEVDEMELYGTKRQAVKRVLRTTRGGALDARDSSYFNGAQRANPWLNNLADLPDRERLDTLRRVLSSRVDPTEGDYQSETGLPTS